MAISLSKGGNVSLSKEDPGLDEIMVGLGWDARSTDGQDFDLDASAFLLKADGKLWSLRTWLGGVNFLWGKPGVLRKCLPEFLAYFRKGFHPWQQDNRELLERNLRELDMTSSAG